MPLLGPDRRFTLLTLGSLLLAGGCAAGHETHATAGSANEAERRLPSCPAETRGASPRPLVDKYCVSCHAPSGAAGADYDFRSDSAIAARRRNIEAKLRLRAMPPASAPQPSDAERAALWCWAKS